MEARVAREPELAAAVIDFGATRAVDPQVVALRNRIVEADLRPFAGVVIRRVVDRPLHVRDPPDARQGVIASLRVRHEGAREGEQRNQPWHVDRRDSADSIRR